MAPRRKAGVKRTPAAKKKATPKRSRSTPTLAPSETEVGRLALRFENMETNMRLLAEAIASSDERQRADRAADREHYDARFDVIEAVLRSHSGEIHALQAAVQENTDGIRQNTADIRSLQAAVAENTADIRSLQTAVAENTAEIRSLQAAVAENTAAIRQNSADIGDLQTTVARIEANMATKQDLAALDARVQRLEEHLPTGT